MRMFLGLAIMVLVCGMAQGAEDRPPNVVLIVSDDQGYNDLGVAGSEEIITPHLDRLAEQGTRLTSFYVAWPACTPSRASLLTGRFPQRNGTYDMIRNDRVNDGHRYTPDEYEFSPERILGTDTREIFISEVLSGAGYRCGVFGKWDGGQLRRFLPLQRGFHDFYGFCNTGIDYFTHERYGVPSMQSGNELTIKDKGTYATTLFEQHATEFIEKHHDKPFFLYVPFNAPHGASSLDPEVRGTVQATPEFLAMYPEGKNRREERRRGYLAAVTHMDHSIGKLMDLLDKYEIADNTLVIFFSDNGGSGLADNTPLRGTKAMMFEGGNRVPCIVRWPNKVPAGKVSDEFLTALEIFPTLCAATGVSPPEKVELDGFDMLAVLRGEIESPRREMFWRRRSDLAARVGDWKWVDSARGGGLFNLKEDISEANDLSEKHAEKLKELKDRFAAWERTMEQAEPRGPFRDY